MRKILIAGALAALAVPTAAFADHGANPKSPAQHCRALLGTMGEANFKSTYGTNASRSNAFGKCVSRYVRTDNANRQNAAQRCRAERNDPNFAASHGGESFAEFYGTNRNNRNAFGRCVSSKARAATAHQQANRLNAARTCRAEQRQDPAAFRRAHGTNRNDANAFGKCVAKVAANQS